MALCQIVLVKNFLKESGILDFSSEVELWTRAGHIKIELKRGIDICKFERLLAEYIL